MPVHQVHRHTSKIDFPVSLNPKIDGDQLLNKLKGSMV